MVKTSVSAHVYQMRLPIFQAFRLRRIIVKVLRSDCLFSASLLRKALFPDRAWVGQPTSSTQSSVSESPAASMTARAARI